MAAQPNWLPALAIFIVLAVVFTWPVARDPTTAIYGVPGDSSGQVALTEYRADLGVSPLSTASTPDENAPFGLPLPGATSLPQLAVEGPLLGIRILTGDPVLAYNLMILLGLVLTPLAAYLLCRRLTGSWWAGLIAGVAYGFNPWHLERAAGHIHFTHLESLPLMVLALIAVREGAGRRAWMLLAAATVLAAYTNTYFTLYIGTILAAYLAVDLGAALVGRSRRALRHAIGRAGFAVSIVVAALLPQGLWLVWRGDEIDAALVGTRDPSDLITYGSRWFEWLVPSHRHPLFDSWTKPFLAERLHGSNPGETALYLGAAVIVLAVGGAAIAVARRRRDPAGARTATFAGALVVLGFVVSLPKEVSPLGLTIPMPSSVISQVFEHWRVYARLFAVVDLGVVVLAAIAVALLLGRLPSRVAPICAAALAALIAVDLSVSGLAFATTPPPVYQLLAAQPPGARVEYPIVRPITTEHLRYIFHTRAARRPLMNGGKPGTPGASFQGRLGEPSAPWVPRALATLGVRYMVIHEGMYPEGLFPQPSAGYRLIERLPPDALYEVVAEPAPVVAAPGEGFGEPEAVPGGRFEQWLQAEAGTISLVNSTDRPRSVTLRTQVESFRGPRTLRVTSDAGTLLARRIDERILISIRVTVSPGVSELRLETDRPPSRVGGADPRRVAIRMAGVEVRSAGAAPIQVG